MLPFDCIGKAVKDNLQCQCLKEKKRNNVDLDNSGERGFSRRGGPLDTPTNVNALMA